MARKQYRTLISQILFQLCCKNQLIDIQRVNINNKKKIPFRVWWVRGGGKCYKTVYSEGKETWNQTIKIADTMGLSWYPRRNNSQGCYYSFERIFFL